MNLEELVTASISEFLDVEVHKDTETLDLSSKIEIVRKRMMDKVKNGKGANIMKNGTNGFEYEMFFSSNPNDMIKIDGWVPIETEKIGELDKISEYIDIGLLRKIESSLS